MKKSMKKICTLSLALTLASGMLSGYGVLRPYAQVSVQEAYEEEVFDLQSGFTYEHDPMENPAAAVDILPDENAIYGYVPNPEGSLAVYATYDFSDPDVVAEMRAERVAYHNEMNRLLDLLISMKDEGKCVEEIARALSALRNEIRLEAYKDNPEGLAKVKERNLEKYGNENGPTPEYLYEKYGSWEMVAEKSFSPNLGADAILGLYDEYYDQDTEYIHNLVTAPISLEKATVKCIASYTYTGRKITPAVRMQIGGRTLVKGTDYTATYTNNVNVGTATVKITGKGEYAGTLTKTFKVLPQGTSLKTLTAGAKSFTVSWTKQTAKMSKSNVTGYQIQYSTKKDFSSDKQVKTASGYTSGKRVIKGLTKGKTYYVRVRTYTKVNGVNHFSDWSAAKSVKIK